MEAVENSLPAGFAPFFRCGSGVGTAAVRRDFGCQKIIILCDERCRRKVRWALVEGRPRRPFLFSAPDFGAAVRLLLVQTLHHYPGGLYAGSARLSETAGDARAVVPHAAGRAGTPLFDRGRRK